MNRMLGTVLIFGSTVKSDVGTPGGLTAPNVPYGNR